jgi:hypothetical protein
VVGNRVVCSCGSGPINPFRWFSSDQSDIQTVGFTYFVARVLLGARDASFPTTHVVIGYSIAPALRFLSERVRVENLEYLSDARVGDKILLLTGDSLFAAVPSL